ncbi:MAG: hypothetical protein JXR26_07565 [Balneolaceae bacterium]|nr:hypothetical protein [Balneolaceae bacterium]
MNIRKSYWIVFLSVLLSLSLALPYCCHTDISKLFSHHQEMASHTMHGENSDASKCDCGHEFVKDFQKAKKVVTGQNIPSLQTVALTDKLSFFLFDRAVMRLSAVQPRILADTGPPLHLLNSVFLN